MDRRARRQDAGAARRGAARGRTGPAGRLIDSRRSRHLPRTGPDAAGGYLPVEPEIRERALALPVEDHPLHLAVLELEEVGGHGAEYPAAAGSEETRAAARPSIARLS